MCCPTVRPATSTPGPCPRARAAAPHGPGLQHQFGGWEGLLFHLGLQPWRQQEAKLIEQSEQLWVREGRTGDARV